MKITREQIKELYDANIDPTAIYAFLRVVADNLAEALAWTDEEELDRYHKVLEATVW